VSQGAAEADEVGIVMLLQHLADGLFSRTSAELIRNTHQPDIHRFTALPGLHNFRISHFLAHESGFISAKDIFVNPRRAKEP